MSVPNPIIHDLSLLAFKAALQLDAIRRNAEQPPGGNYLEQLVKRLKDNINEEPSERVIRRLAPPDVEVWSKALKAYSGESSDSDGDMAEKMKDILDTLGNRRKIQGKNIEKLLGFCTALHSALLQKNSFFEQPEMPDDPRRF